MTHFRRASIIQPGQNPWLIGTIRALRLDKVLTNRFAGSLLSSVRSKSRGGRKSKLSKARSQSRIEDAEKCYAQICV